MKKILFSLCLALAAQAASAAFPDKPITIINPFAAGGLGNNLGRILAEGMAERLGQPVIVDNKAGAGGIIGFNYVKAAPADGYTLVLGTISTLSLAPSLYRKLPFDGLKDFVPVAMAYTSPNILVVNRASPYKSLGELANAAKNNPHGLTYAITGNGTTGHILGGTLKGVTGGNLIPVAYKGTAPAIVGMLGGECDFWFGATDTLPHIADGKLRALAVATRERYSKLPNVPTTTEAGFPELVLESWYGILAPAGTPPEVVKRLNQAIAETLASPRVREQARTLDTEVAKDTSQKYFAERIQADLLRWRPVIEKAGITGD